MHALIDWIVLHASHAHWFIFGALILAGLNIPFSADFMIIVAGFLAATVVPDHLWHLYVAVVIGGYLSAMVSYGIGRWLGPRLLKWPLFHRFFPQTRLKKMQLFYAKYGLWTLMVGRFIPFGVRNCIFMSSGISRVPFLKFASRDLLACFTWGSAVFCTVWQLGHHYEVLLAHIKLINFIIFGAFSVTVIAWIWYKRTKKTANV
jgi:membrane protein DedA with SNARE-associated domain